MERANPLVFVDLEVAGGELYRPVIQVAAIATGNNFQVLESFEAKLKFDSRLADPRSLTRTRYCQQVWEAEACCATSVARRFAQFLRQHTALAARARQGRTYRVAQLAAHNAPFDGPFLQTWFERTGAYFPADYRMLCTMQRALWLFQEFPHLRRPADFKLGTLCSYFGVPLSADQVHTALADVRATAELYRRITLLRTAETASWVRRPSPVDGAIPRVGGVAPWGFKTCRSRRRTRPKACRSRRRHSIRGRL